MKVTVIPIVFGILGMVSKDMVKESGGSGGQKTNGDHPGHNTAEIG